MSNLYVDLTIPGHELLLFNKLYASYRDIGELIAERIRNAEEPGYTLCYIFAGNELMPRQDIYYDKLGTALYFGFIHPEFKPEDVITFTKKRCNARFINIKQRDFEPMLGQFTYECANFIDRKKRDFYFFDSAQKEVSSVLDKIKHEIGKYAFKYQFIKTDHRSIVRIYGFDDSDLKNYALKTRLALGKALAYGSENGQKYIKIGPMIDEITNRRVSDPLIPDCVGVLR